MLPSFDCNKPDFTQNEILNALQAFLFTSGPKHALNELNDTFVLYEYQLKELKEPEMFPLAKEILVSQFKEQFSELYANIEYILGSIQEEVLRDMKYHMSAKYLIDRETLIKKFRKRVLENFKTGLPELLLTPYITRLEELMSWNDSYEPMDYITKNDFEDICNQFIIKLLNKTIVLLDTKELSITEQCQQKLFILIIKALAFAITKFTSLEHLEWITIINTICELMPISKTSLDEINSVLGLLNMVVGRKERKVIANNALLNLALELPNFNKHQLTGFVVYLFLIISGYYQSNEQIANKGYSPILRASIRKMLNGLHEKLKQKDTKVASIVNFEYYKVFEKAIGTHLNIRSLYTELHSEEKKINLVEIINKVPGVRSALRKLNISDAKIDKMPFYVENLTPHRHSPHVIICFSGYLSENSDMHEDWKDLLSTDTESCIYAIRWPSKKAMVDSPSIKKVLPSLILAKYTPLAMISATVLGLIDAVRSNFGEAEREAKVVGYAMAHIISKSGIFKDQCVSLIGFSLGTRAVLSCIKELERINDYESNNVLIDNVVMMGGAAIIKKESIKKWFKRFNSVSGRVINVYATNDWALKVFRLIRKQNPIGTDEIKFEKAVKSEDVVVECKGCKIENFNVTKIVSGHLSYRKYLESILKRINFG